MIIKCDRISYVQCVRFNNQSTHQHSYVFSVLYLKIILLSSYTDSFISSIFLLFQEHVNKIDFDYMEYARQRFQQYWAKKPEVLGPSKSSTKP